MIAFLKGTVSMVGFDRAYLLVGGVGFEVFMSSNALSKLPQAGEEALVLTYMQVSDSGIALYGFHNENEKALFEKLIGVSGVGPKVALAALSTYDPERLVAAIAEQDVSAVQKIPGVGKKTASRIILELKGSFEADAVSLFSHDDGGDIVKERLKGATEALLSMGFTSEEAELALRGAPEGAVESALLQYALKRLGTL